ncbi:hypothetical protein, partial [Klebsiella variicola]
KSLDDFCKRIGQQIEADGLDDMLMTLEAQQESLSVSVSESGERRMEMRQQTEQLKQQIQSLTVKAPAWLAAQEALTQLCEQSHETFTSANDVTEYMQQLLEREREVTVERDEIALKKAQLEKDIERLS